MNPFTRALNLLVRIDETTTKTSTDLAEFEAGLAEIDRRLTIIEGRTAQMSADLDAMLTPHRHVA